MPERPHPMLTVAALAFVSGRWDGGPADLVPQTVWDGLYANGLIVSHGDDTGESWPVITREGEAFLLGHLAALSEGERGE